MGKLFYTFSIFLYRVAIRIATLFNKKARLFVKGRKNLLPRIKKELQQSNAPVAWFHCASLGEFEQGRPVMEAFKKNYPHYKIVLTFFSPSGYEVRKNYEGADHIFYLPMDTGKNARLFLNYVKPKIAFFIKYEFWKNYTSGLKARKIPLLSVSSIFRKDQLFFKSYGKFYKSILKDFTWFFVQDRESLKLLASININNASVSGDTRFDRVLSICEDNVQLPQVSRFKNNKKVMVIGSCWPEDFDELNSFINDTGIKFIIAPHEIEEKFLQRIERDLLKKCIRYSAIDDNDPADFDVLIIDNIGMLSSLYTYGEYAFVGGGYGQGLHNILEPATFGIPIFFGNKNYNKFREAKDLINLGGAVAVADYDELRTQFRSFTDETTYNIASGINKDYVKDSTGATGKIINYCKTLIS